HDDRKGKYKNAVLHIFNIDAGKVRIKEKRSARRPEDVVCKRIPFPNRLMLTPGLFAPGRRTKMKLIRQKDRVDNVDDAVRLTHIGDRDRRAAALLVGEDKTLAVHHRPQLAARDGRKFGLAVAVFYGLGDRL